MPSYPLLHNVFKMLDSPEVNGHMMYNIHKIPLLNNHCHIKYTKTVTLYYSIVYGATYAYFSHTLIQTHTHTHTHSYLLKICSYIWTLLNAHIYSNVLWELINIYLAWKTQVKHSVRSKLILLEVINLLPITELCFCMVDEQGQCRHSWLLK